MALPFFRPAGNFWMVVKTHAARSHLQQLANLVPAVRLLRAACRTQRGAGREGAKRDSSRSLRSVRTTRVGWAIAAPARFLVKRPSTGSCRSLVAHHADPRSPFGEAARRVHSTAC